MKNDLTAFEKSLLRSINSQNKTNYNHTHLMQWDTNKANIIKDIQKGEIMYNVLGCFVAIKP